MESRIFEDIYFEEFEEIIGDFDQGHISCEFCGESESEYLFKCLDHGCDKIFCNVLPLRSNRGSHIYQHLVNEKHNIIQINSVLQPYYGDLVCSKCGCRNIFSLGILKKSKKVMCRNPCFLRSRMPAESWDHAFIERALKLSDTTFEKNTRYNGPKRNNLQKLNPTERANEELRIYRQYPNLGEYHRIFNGLLMQELDSENERNEGMVLKNVHLHFTGNPLKVSFFGNEIGCRLTVGNKITLTSLYGWESGGEIVQILKTGEFFVMLEVWHDEEIREVDITIITQSSTIKKIIDGLNEFIESSGTLDNGIMEAVLTGTPSVMSAYAYMDNFSVKGLFNLNPSQNEAVKRAIHYKCSIIQGPPGTGKTETAAAIIYHISKKCSNRPHEVVHEENYFLQYSKN